MGLFQSFFQGGFECATHRNINRERVDVVASTGHERFAAQDYGRLTETGIETVREGARWHLIESAPGTFDFTTLARIYDAAQASGIEIILDLMHFGWPDFVDVFSPEFIRSFERFVGMAARFLNSRGLDRHFVIPINEISFLAWAGGDRALMSPHACGRGPELKRQLVKAAIAASQVLLEELPSVRLLSAEPAIHVVGRNYVPGDRLAAERQRLGMFESLDMLTGKSCPELGGSPEYLDIVGVNFYSRNQWVHQAETLTRDDVRYRPLHQILAEVWRRYRRPVLLAETGTEDDARAAWLAYVSDQARLAVRGGVPMAGICLYPVLNHPGWDDDRHCNNGLFDYADDDGCRPIHIPLADAIRAEHRRWANVEAEPTEFQLIA